MASTQGTLLALVSSWTDGLHGAGGNGGVRVYRVGEGWSQADAQDPELNAGFLAYDARRATVYVTDERKDISGNTGGGYVVSYALDTTTAGLSRTGTASTIGPNPSYVDVDATGSFVLTANHGNTYHAAVRIGHGEKPELVYDDGSVALVPLRADGAVSGTAHVAVLDADPGPDPKHQRSSHPHSAVADPTGSLAIVCDKGTDSIYSFRIDRAGLTRLQRYRSRAGAAPRHALFHPGNSLLYVINELESSIDVFEPDLGDGTLTHRQTVSTVPFDEPGDNHPSDIALHPSGAFLYASNRGHDSICSYTVDTRTGFLEPVNAVPAGGRRPRGVTVSPDGRAVYAVCMDADLISAIPIDEKTGALQGKRDIIPVPRPTCLRFVPVG